MPLRGTTRPFPGGPVPRPPSPVPHLRFQPWPPTGLAFLPIPQRLQPRREAIGSSLGTRGGGRPQESGPRAGAGDSTPSRTQPRWRLPDVDTHLCDHLCPELLQLPSELLLLLVHALPVTALLPEVLLKDLHLGRAGGRASAGPRGQSPPKRLVSGLQGGFGDGGSAGARALNCLPWPQAGKGTTRLSPAASAGHWQCRKGTTKTLGCPALHPVGVPEHSTKYEERGN